jgi:hypothetical protein
MLCRPATRLVFLPSSIRLNHKTGKVSAPHSSVISRYFFPLVLVFPHPTEAASRIMTPASLAVMLLQKLPSPNHFAVHDFVEFVNVVCHPSCPLRSKACPRNRTRAVVKSFARLNHIHAKATQQPRVGLEPTTLGPFTRKRTEALPIELPWRTKNRC